VYVCVEYSDDGNVFLGEELLHNKRRVARCVIVMQEPLSLPLVAQLPPNCIVQHLQNLHLEMTGNALPKLYEITVRQIFHVKKTGNFLTNLIN
jgi:hypothetical protein